MARGTKRALWNYIENNFRGQVFTTTQLLELRIGKRGTVDSALWAFVDEGKIERLANGVFFLVTQDSANSAPGPLDIIEAKALAFGKRIGSTSSPMTFTTDRRSSSFISKFGRLFLNQTSPQNIKELAGSKSLRKNAVNLQALLNATYRRLERQARGEIQSQKYLMTRFLKSQ